MFRSCLFLLLLWATGPLLAIARRIHSDEELAQFPIIVVAKWEKAGFRSHAKKPKNSRGEAVVEQWETYTKLKIIRTIKGDGVLPGEHELMIGYGISWDKEGKGLESGTSTQILGDVDDVTVPRIWFLRKDRSWDSKDQNDYLAISNFRCVQDVILEEFFVAVGNENAGKKVSLLLESDEREVVKRSLRFLCGARDPWPVGRGEDEPEWFYELQKKGETYPVAAAEIRNVVGRTKHDDLEPLFIAAYAKLAQEIDLEFLKRCLESKNVDSRIVAACHLIRREQFTGLEGIETGDGRLGLVLRLISEIGNKSDLRLVPLLLAQLENGENGGHIGSSYFIPALKAREALVNMTGCLFPFDVAVSSKAWAAARDEKRERRIEIVSKLAPAVEKPFKAEIIGSPKAPHLRLTNVSHLPTMISSRPSGISQSAPGMSSSRYPERDEDAKFQMVAPGGFFDFPFELEKRLILFPENERSIEISFLDNGREAGRRAWIGVVKVSFGEEWTEKRRQKKVEELWPNGNLKMIGQTVNGERVGDWEFFNEEGDRVRGVDYSNGGHKRKESRSP